MPKLYHDDLWNSVEKKGVKDFLSKVSPIDDQYTGHEDKTHVYWRPLPFYKKVALVKAEDETWGEKTGPLYFLGHKGDFKRLDGMSTPIHEINHTTKINLNENNVLDYMRFFCLFVHGDDGPFTIVETMDQVDLPTTARDEVKQLVEQSLQPAAFEGMTEDNKYNCIGMVYYGTSLFSARFHVYPNGLIEMVEDNNIIEDTAS
jgi:hypothetical protein